MRALVTVMPLTGHVAPMTGLVEELVRRGHEVTVYTGTRSAPRFAALGAEVAPWSAAQDFDEDDISATFPTAARPGPLGAFGMVEQVFFRTGVGQVADLTDLVRRWPPDVVVADVMSLGGGLLVELTGLPWVTVGVLAYNCPNPDGPPPGFPVGPARGRLGRARDRLMWGAYRALTMPISRVDQQVREAVGLGRRPGVFGTGLYSPSLVLATGSPGLERSPTSLPESVHFVGRLPPAGLPHPDALDPPTPGRPRILVTQGTHNVDLAQLVRPALAGLADLDVDVLATTGRRGVTDVGGPVPGNAKVVDLVDFDAALAGTAVLVTNGGWGGVLAAVAAGVPLVIAGGDIDKPENAARVARCGAGINLRTGQPKPAAVAAAVSQVLADPSYRDRAAAMRAELAALGGPATAADLIERLAADR